MYTIKQAARMTGVPEASLRAWERRYGVVTPRRTESGYRIYDDESVATVSAMRRLVQAGWSPAEAARRLRPGARTVSGRPTAADDVPGENAATHMELFLSSAALLDTEGIEESLDRGLALGSFEHVVDSWLFPTLEALGESWMRGEVDVAGEHAASAAVHRRLSAAYQAAGSRSRGASVVVGLPSGSRHELGALAFATALRRTGMDVLYLGADVPDLSWDRAVRARSARAAVLAVVTPADRPRAAAVANRLRADHPNLVVASGGACGDQLGGGVHALAPMLGVAAQQLDALLHDSSAA
jgi:DNA-binding transcriptional MerR regulator/methylmalonyl-CoA mutase cobalamin-binding subunit